MKILIIEDDKQVATSLKNGFVAEHYSVEIAVDGKEGLSQTTEQFFDIALISTSSSKFDGFKVLASIREAGSAVPVMILAGDDELENKLKAFQLGADDYIVKPLELEEVILRIKAIVRRTAFINSAEKLHCGDIVLNTVRRTASKGDEEMTLTVKEYALLEYFIKNSNKILSRASIIQNVWNQNLDSDSNIIDVYVKRLRTKFEKSTNANPYIQSIRGIGYRFRERRSANE